MHPNDPTQTISPLKEDFILSKKSPPHLPLCGIFCAYYGCPHPRLRRAKNKIFCKDSREICGEYGKQERVGLALCLSCVPRGGPGCGAVGFVTFYIGRPLIFVFIYNVG